MMPKRLNQRNTVIPKLPWPLPVAGCDIEVAHWPYQSSSERNAGEWFYVVLLSVDEWSRAASIVAVLLRGLRFRQDYVTNRRYDQRFLDVWRELEVNRRLRQPPAELTEVFQSFVTTVRDRAPQDHKLYEVSRARALSWT